MKLFTSFKKPSEKNKNNVNIMRHVFHQRINGELILFLFSILIYHNGAMRNATEDAVEAKAAGETQLV